MKTAHIKQGIACLLSILFLHVQNGYSQEVPYVSYPIEGVASTTDRPDPDPSRDADLSLGGTSQEFVAIAPNALWPSQQVECFPLLIDFLNSSPTAANNVIGEVSITDESNGNLVFSDSLFFGQVPGSTFIENSLFEDCYTPDGSITEYNITYSLTSDCVDPNPDNNEAESPFEVTQNVFSKETGGTQIILPAASNWEAGEPHSWAYGNSYFIKEGPVQAKEAIFSIGNADDVGVAGQLLNIALYHWVDSNSDQSLNPDEREIVGIGLYEIQGEELPDDLINLELFDPNSGNPVILQSQSTYVLMIEYHTNDFVDVYFVASTDYNYAAQVHASLEIGQPRYASMLAIGVDLSDQPYSSIGFGRDVVPVARLMLGEGPVDHTHELSKGQNVLAISPNPGKGIVDLQLSGGNAVIDGHLVIYDQVGHSIANYKIDLLPNQSFKVDVSHFANGVYFAHFIADDTANSGSFIVNH